MNFVYILLCNDSSYYVCSTSNVDDRLERHNAGRAATYTAIRQPVTQAYSEEHPEQRLPRPEVW